MSSRRSVRQLLVAVIVGVLVGGGLMAVTPAGAEVSSALATNWKKIWKKELKPLADKRYYTKKKSDSRYQPKGSYAPNGSSYTKAESDAKYAGAGSSYSKAESDGRYVSKTVLRRGTFALGTTAAAANEFMLGDISYGITLTEPPAAHYIPLGAPVPAGCAGDAANPDAQPGNLCVFESAVSNADTTALFAITTAPGSSTMGAWVRSLSVAAGTAYVGGSWAMRPGTPAAGQRPASPRGQLVP